jgi:hypothetical protein
VDVVGFHDDFNGMPLTLHQQQHLVMVPLITPDVVVDEVLVASH